MANTSIVNFFKGSESKILNLSGDIAASSNSLFFSDDTYNIFMGNDVSVISFTKQNVNGTGLLNSYDASSKTWNFTPINNLTFTGAASGIYNGSSPLTINIPEGATYTPGEGISISGSTISALEASESQSGIVTISDQYFTGNKIIIENNITITSSKEFYEKILSDDSSNLIDGNMSIITPNGIGCQSVNNNILYQSGISNGLIQFAKMNINTETSEIVQIVFNDNKIKIIGSDSSIDFIADKFVTNGGTSNQLVTGDGTLITKDSITSNYLPLTGGTINGTINTSYNNNTFLNVANLFKFQLDTDTENLIVLNEENSKILELTSNGLVNELPGDVDFNKLTINTNGYIELKNESGQYFNLKCDDQNLYINIVEGTLNEQALKLDINSNLYLGKTNEQVATQNWVTNTAVVSKANKLINSNNNFIGLTPQSPVDYNSIIGTIPWVDAAGVIEIGRIVDFHAIDSSTDNNARVTVTDTQMDISNVEVKCNTGFRGGHFITNGGSADQLVAGDGTLIDKSTLGASYTAGTGISISDNTISALEASATQAGIVSTGTQSIAGIKWFEDEIKIGVRSTPPQVNLLRLYGDNAGGYIEGNYNLTLTSKIGSITLDASTTTAQNINAAQVNSTGGFFDTSDKRLKENVKSVNDEIISEKVNKIGHLKEFDFIENKKHSYGYIAQEIEEILPEAVSENSDGFKTLNYEMIMKLQIQYLMNEIKELKKEIIALKKSK